MKKQIIVALGLALVSTSALVGGRGVIVINDDDRKPWVPEPFPIPDPAESYQIPESNEFIRRKIAESQRRKK